MSDQAPEATDVAEDALLLAVKGLDARLEKLEAEDKKTLLKTVTTNASTSALRTRRSRRRPIWRDVATAAGRRVT